MLIEWRGWTRWRHYCALSTHSQGRNIAVFSTTGAFFVEAGMLALEKTWSRVESGWNRYLRQNNQKFQTSLVPMITKQRLALHNSPQKNQFKNVASSMQ